MLVLALQFSRGQLRWQSFTGVKNRPNRPKRSDKRSYMRDYSLKTEEKTTSDEYIRQEASLNHNM
jgi:hypothetical protein